MKTQCPNCNKQFKAPDEYEGKKVKCTKCDFVFYAKKIEDKINELLKKAIHEKPKGQNFFIKIWNNSPMAFRTAFLATLGVISALVIAYLCLDWANTIKKFPSKSKWLSEDVYSIAMLYSYAGELQSIQSLSRSIAEVFVKNPRIFIHLSVIFKPTIDRLETLKTDLSDLQISQNIEDFERVKNAYLEAIYAEQDVIGGLISLSKTSEIDPLWDQKIKRVNERTTDATLKLTALLFKLDPQMGEAIEKLKK